METMAYPCSPLIPFPTQHEESSYLLWSPQVVIPLENGNMCDADADPSPDQQQQDHEFMNMTIQEANCLLLQDDLSNGDPLLTGFDQRLEGQENGSLLAVQEEFMEESSLSGILEAQDSISASAILSRLDDLIAGVPYRNCHHAEVSSSEHLACYFARGLQSRISGALTECHPATASAPGNRMPAYRMLQELSPFIKFAHFTANQAILEATADDPGVHVVDLNVGEGVQWASLMSDLARHGGKPFHLTAAVTADADCDAAGAHPTAARWLSEFAESLNLPFQYSSLHLRSEADLRDFATSCNGGPVIVSCDTTDKSYSSLIRLQMQLLGSVKILQPKLVILIEQELFRMDRSLAPFAEFFCEVLQHFAAMLESLESCFRDGGYGACLGLVEKETLGPMIEDAVRQYVPLTGGAGAELEGFRACELSSFNVAQGKMLAGLFSRGFGVVHEEGRLALCWNSRPLTSVSVWSPV
ncbi:Nodulation-signaling pathway 2 protein [Dichanthelium oligosanthes]|uniref:Nodulation-signaling pathway 2 protein n=1 Tax=Dichanthelium oligosanthes TaxID=888268 RepID=A0A1E5W3L9_9POAL|nr:Nodulation-signaling pathway 2 protein [Dichanthelium oligosanthes]